MKFVKELLCTRKLLCHGCLCINSIGLFLQLFASLHAHQSPTGPSCNDPTTSSLLPTHRSPPPWLAQSCDVSGSVKQLDSQMTSSNLISMMQPSLQPCYQPLISFILSTPNTFLSNVNGYHCGQHYFSTQSLVIYCT